MTSKAVDKMSAMDDLSKTLIGKIDASLVGLNGFTTGQEIYELVDIHLNEARAHLEAAKASIDEWKARMKARKDALPQNGRPCPKCFSTSTRQFCVAPDRPVPGRFQCNSSECRGRHWFEIDGKEVAPEEWQKKKMS